MRSLISPFAVLLIAGCADAPPPPPASPTSSAPAAPAAPAPRAEAVRLEADTPSKTPSGATFEAPKGWLMTKTTDGVVLEAPEGDLTITIVEVREKDAEKSIALAWEKRSDKRGASLKPKTTSKPPPREGWDEIVQIAYDIPAAEGRAVIALARRKGEISHVAFLEGKVAGFDRRGAQLGTTLGSFRAPGVEEESFAGKKANTLDAKKLEAFAAFVEESRVKAKVPGVAVAIIQDRKVVFEKGFGARVLGKKDSVTPDTLFMIGSITKPLTSLMMAKLVDEGRFTWDTPVTQVAPGFALGDPEATKKLAMRHTVCACTGLPRQDMTFFFGFGKTTPESRLEEMKGLKPTTAFGETFQYSNLMVSAGGYVAARAAEGNAKKPLGAAYDDAMRTRVLDPIGMKSSTFDFAVAEKRDHSNPHTLTTTGDVASVPVSAERWIPSIRPAGGLWSSARDMARWVAVELDGGKTIDGKTIVTQANLLERRKPMARVAEKMSYGLALMVEKYDGVDVVWHTGGTLGFNTLAAWLPEHGVGLVFLTNLAGGGPLMSAARRKLFELLFDGKDEARENLAFSLKRRADAMTASFATLERTPDKDWTAKLAGEYQSTELGRVTFRSEGGKAIIDTGEWKSAIGRVKEGDTDKIVLLDPPWFGFEFIVKDLSTTPTVTLDAGQEKYLFVRREATRQ
ncbi:MAG: beta-lactamase family protein [Labilithrix sp.]|nr:beta-lactamase family protein [Labilithrix sp.]